MKTNFDLNQNQIETMLNLPDEKKKNLLMLNRKVNLFKSL